MIQMSILRLLNCKCFINVKMNVSHPAVRHKSRNITSGLVSIVCCQNCHDAINVFLYRFYVSPHPNVVFPAIRRCCSPQFTVIELLTKGGITKEYHKRFCHSNYKVLGDAFMPYCIKYFQIDIYVPVYLLLRSFRQTIQRRAVQKLICNRNVA